MSDAKAHILRRLRANTAQERQAPPPIPVRRFAWGPAERLQRLRARLEAVRGEVHEIGADWPRRMHALLHEKGGGNLLYGPDGPHGPALEQGWPDRDKTRLHPYREPVEACRDTLFQATDAGFTSCRGAIAETGALVLWPTPEEPRLLSLVPPIHFILLDAAEIYSTWHEMLTRQPWQTDMPGNALLISGPSKSADIEQTLAYGVHGPKALIVLVQPCTNTSNKNHGEWQETA